MNDLELRMPVPRAPILKPYRPQPGPMRQRIRGLMLLLSVLLLAAVYGFLFALSTYLVMVLLVPLAVIMGLIIWVLPDYDRAPTELVRKLFFGTMIVMVLWPNYIAIAIPGLPWISLQRLFLLPMCMTLLVSLSISERFRAEMRQTLQAWPTMWKMLAGFVAIQFLSVSMSYARPLDALKDLFNFQLLWTATFFASVHVFRDARNIRLWFAIVLAAAVVLALIGVPEAMQRQTLWATHVPSFLKIDGDMIDLILKGSARAEAYRVQATFSTSLACAEFLALASPVVVHRFMTTRAPIVRFFCLVADVAILVTIMETQSRLGLIGFLSGHAFYMGAYFVRLWRRDRGSIAGPALTLAYPAALVLLVGAVLTVHSVSTRVLGGGETHASNVSRAAQWNGALRVLAQSPVFGHGPHSGAVALGFHDPSGLLTLDSYLLTILLDYGAVGFLLYYGMIILALVKALELGMRSAVGVRACGLAIASMLLVFLTTKAVLSQEDNNAIAFMLMGMTAALAARDKTPPG